MSDTGSTVIVFSFLLAFNLVLCLIMYDALRSIKPFQKLPRIGFCRIGWHKMTKKVDGRKTKTYFCVHCKKKRSFPDLKLVESDSKIHKNDYKF